MTLKGRATDAATVLANGPLTTRGLLDALELDHTLVAVADLHRAGRSRGYGQCRDGMWRSAGDSDELRSLIRDDQSTPSHHAFLALWRSEFEGWDIDTPLLAAQSISVLEERHRKVIETLDAKVSRAVDYLRSAGVPHAEIQRILFTDVASAEALD